MKLTAYEETIERDGCNARIRIEYDRDGINPRTEWDNVGTILYSSDRHTLGDENIRGDMGLHLYGLACDAVGRDYDEETYNRLVFGLSESNTRQQAGRGALWRFVHKHLIILPVYAYIHGGVTISTGNGYPYNDRWDGGACGFIYCTRTKAALEWTGADSEKRALDYLRGEIETFDAYLRGDCFYYTVEVTDADGHTQDADSCGGYVGSGGDYGGALEQAREAANYDLGKITEAGHYQAAGI